MAFIGEPVGQLLSYVSAQLGEQLIGVATTDHHRSAQKQLWLKSYIKITQTIAEVAVSTRKIETILTEAMQADSGHPLLS